MIDFDKQQKLNPFSGYTKFSSYAKFQDNELIKIIEPEKKLSNLACKVRDSFRSHVSNTEYPCLGAKAAFNGNCYRFGFYDEMTAPETTAGLAFDLWTYVQEIADFGSDYATFVACFEKPKIRNEKKWEEILWAQLTELNRLDQTHFPWNPNVSSDPESPNFSFSFAGTAFFIVGMNPVSSRISRKFPWATLVFNTQDQFQRLRSQNKFERMQQAIRARDLKLQGSLNPNLSNFGERSDARQYSGRAVEEDWKCPFHKQS